MTYKRTLDATTRIARTASHATKPHPLGRIDAIPRWAAEPEDYYNSLRQSYQSIVDQYRAAKADLDPLDELARCGHLSKAETPKVEELRERHDLLLSRLREMRPAVIAADHQARAAISFFAAQKFLTPAHIERIEHEVDQFLTSHRQFPTLLSKDLQIDAEERAAREAKSKQNRARAESATAHKVATLRHERYLENQERGRQKSNKRFEALQHEKVKEDAEFGAKLERLRAKFAKK